MYVGKKEKTLATLQFTLFIIILSQFIQFSYAAEWSSENRLTWEESIDYAPSIAQAQDGRIWVVWHSLEIGPPLTNPDIFYKIYDNSSTFEWLPANKLTTDPNTDKTPSITFADDKVWVVWSSNRDGNWEIYYTIYNGMYWYPECRLTTNSSRDEFPSVMEDSDGHIWVVWSSNRDGNYEIYYKIYFKVQYQYYMWLSEGRLTSNPGEDWDPSIMQAEDGNIWVVWTRDDDLYYKVIRATNLATNIEIDEVVSDTPLTATTLYIDWHPSIMQAEDGDIWVVWDSLRAETNIDVYCRVFNGTSWSEEKITHDSGDDVMPTIMQASDGTMWITWSSNRLDNDDIYYITNPSIYDLYDVAIISITHNPDVAVAFQGLTTSISVISQNYGMENEEFQVTCYANSTIIGSQPVILAAGQLTSTNFAWNTTTMTPGNYTISAEASIVPGETDTADNIRLDGIIQVRIPGDADFNGIVELDDFVHWVLNVGKTREELSVNAYADFDNNGLVDLSDYPVWVYNLGRE